MWLSTNDKRPDSINTNWWNENTRCTLDGGGHALLYQITAARRSPNSISFSFRFSLSRNIRIDEIVSRRQYLRRAIKSNMRQINAWRRTRIRLRTSPFACVVLLKRVFSLHFLAVESDGVYATQSQLTAQYRDLLICSTRKVRDAEVKKKKLEIILCKSRLTLGYRRSTIGAQKR